MAFIFIRVPNMFDLHVLIYCAQFAPESKKEIIYNTFSIFLLIFVRLFHSILLNWNRFKCLKANIFSKNICAAEQYWLAC